MDGTLAYDNKERYNFCEETWRDIFTFESKMRSHKLFKKVNFKEGELESYISWVRKVLKKPKIKRLVKNAINYEEKGAFKGKLFNARKRLVYSFKKNRYDMSKVKKDGLLYSFEDISKFISVLNEAKKCNCLKDFLSIPDACFIIRNIVENWEEVKEKIQKNI